jgi:hypothetical protein
MTVIAPSRRAQASTRPPGGERWQEHARRFHAARSASPEPDPERLLKAWRLRPAGDFVRRVCALRDALRG